jgi:hypothetical protein
MPKKSQIRKSGGYWIPRCPYCRTRVPTLLAQRTFLDRNGEHIPVIVVGQLKRAAFEKCRACGKQWPLWAQDEGGSSNDVATIVETHRTEERIGDEVRRIENNSAATIQRTVRASREWTHQIEVGRTEESHGSLESKVTIKGVGLTSQVERSVQKKYDISTTEMQKFDEEVVVSVPANTTIVVTLSWKRIWQNGYLEMTSGHGNIPFRVCVGITFDLRS